MCSDGRDHTWLAHHHVDYICDRLFNSHTPSTSNDVGLPLEEHARICGTALDGPLRSLSPQ